MRKAIAAYYGLVSFVDHNVGRLVKALEDNGLAGETRVIYTSDHGDNLGARGLWGKSNMYEELAAVPMIMAGPEVPQGSHAPSQSRSWIASRPSSIASGLKPHPERPGSAGFAAPRCRQRKGAGAHGDERISRSRRRDRRFHDPQGQVQIRLLRRHACAIVRSRSRSLRTAQSRAGRRLSRACGGLRNGVAQGGRSRGGGRAGPQRSGCEDQGAWRT